MLHFLFAGGLLFAVYGWLYQDEDSEPRLLRISEAEVNWLKHTWTRQWSRPPDEDELRGLVAGHLKEKLLAREARELGLELDDTVVRRRLAQKMEFIVQDVALLAEPAEEELRKLYKKSRERYQTPALISFSQVYFKTEDAARQGLVILSASEEAAVGDSSLLPPDYDKADAQTVSSVFGAEFSASVFNLEADRWHGPVASAYGFHLVFIREHLASQPLTFEAVREKLVEEWQRLRQLEAREKYFAELLKKYNVVVDEGVASLLGPLTEVVQ